MIDLFKHLIQGCHGDVGFGMSGEVKPHKCVIIVGSDVPHVFSDIASLAFANKINAFVGMNYEWQGPATRATYCSTMFENDSLLFTFLTQFVLLHVPMHVDQPHLISRFWQCIRSSSSPFNHFLRA